jgi:hypothetical protein
MHHRLQAAYGQWVGRALEHSACRGQAGRTDDTPTPAHVVLMWLMLRMLGTRDIDLFIDFCELVTNCGDDA